MELTSCVANFSGVYLHPGQDRQREDRPRGAADLPEVWAGQVSVRGGSQGRAHQRDIQGAPDQTHRRCPLPRVHKVSFELQNSDYCSNLKKLIDVIEYFFEYLLLRAGHMRSSRFVKYKLRGRKYCICQGVLLWDN